MFKFGYLKGIHKKNFGTTKEKWEKFVHDLFTTQDGFIGKEKISVKAVRNQWDARIDRFKAKYGWIDGHCQNLSELEKDLNEPDVTIKMMLEEIQVDKTRNEIKEVDIEQSKANDVSVNIQGYNNNAKRKKRPFKQVGNSVKVTGLTTDDANNYISSNTILKADNSAGITDYSQRFIDGVNATTTSSITVSNDEEIITMFTQHLTALGSKHLLRDAYSDCRILPGGFDLNASTAILDSLGLESIARLFFENMGNPKYIKNELKAYGFDKFTEIRLYTYIIKMAKGYSRSSFLVS